MKYTSQNGCFFYYDRDTYSWELCEPTLMFLLGFEAITMYDKAKSDHILISNRIYDTRTGEIDEMQDFPIYDEVLTFLSSLGPVEDNEFYVQYNCYGLKLLMNELTGTGTDRTVPVIFLNDANRKLVDPNKYPYSDKAGKSYYDLQSTLILNIFKYAGYNTLDEEVQYFDEDNVGVDENDPLNTNVPPLLSEIRAYNNSLYIFHEERQASGGVYKLLDYKAMYLYALGVLYGLRCLGYDGKMIWRFDPAYWYFGKYQNLVKTAWAVFRFHFTHPIYELDAPEELIDKYKDIQYNKLWNFMNNEGSDIQLYNNEVFAYGLHIIPRDLVSADEVNRVSVKPIIYLYPTDEDVREGKKGQYIEFIRETSEWSDPKDVEGNEDSSYDLVSSYEPYKGIVAADSDVYTRYIAHDKVTIRKALRFTRNIKDPENPNQTLAPHYLSPNDDTLCTIPRNTELEVLDVYNGYYQVTYTVESGELVIQYTGWIDAKSTESILDVDEESVDTFVDGSFYTDEFTGVGKIKTTSSCVMRYHPGGDKDYFIGAGNLGWTDFDLEYWKNFKEYIASEYDLYGDKDKFVVGSFYTEEFDCEGSELFDTDACSVLSMEPHDYDRLYPARIGQACSKVDGSVVSYYKCNVDDDTYLYGIFDGLATIDENTGKWKFDDVAYNFKYIISDLDFDAIYNSSDASSYDLKDYFNLSHPIKLLVSRVDSSFENGTFFNGTDQVYLALYGYTPKESYPVDAYTYNSDLNCIEEYSIRKYYKTIETGEGSSIETYYWSNNFDVEVGEYGNKYNWRTAYSVPNSIFEEGITTVTVYLNVQKLFEDATVYSNISNGIQTYVLNTNTSYPSKYGQYYDPGSGQLVDIVPIGFVNYADLHDRIGATTYLCQIIEKDPNGDDLIIDGIPYVWRDDQTNTYWNGFTKEWQDTIPTRRNATMYNSATNETQGVTDDTTNRTISVEDGIVLTYDEFYAQYPTCGILRNDFLRVYNPSKEGEGIISCYRDTKLSSNEADHIVCIPTITQWVPRSQLLPMYGYWIVDGTASLYDGDEEVDVVYDDDHHD